MIRRIVQAVQRRFRRSRAIGPARGRLESPPPHAYVSKAPRSGASGMSQQRKVAVMPIDEKTRTALEAAAFRRLVAHLRSRTDVQNIDLMNFAGFCRNCLSNWMKEAADESGVPMSKDESREAIYGMPFEEWKAKYQNEASKAQLAAFAKSSQKH
jgi:uncharacterized protein